MIDSADYSLLYPMEYTIKSASKAKLLVVIVDQHLNWKDHTHISMASHKISKSSGIISHIPNTLDIK